MDVEHSRHAGGFTLVELMIGLAVGAILLMVAVPAFTEYRQRSALRGAVDQLVVFWGDARFEALRRNSLVKVSFVESSGSFCMGAATTTDRNDETPCDCLTAGACNIAAFPANQSEWKRNRVPAAADLGNAKGVAVIDPKRGALTATTMAGSVYMQSPDGGSADYRLNFVVDRNGRAVVCEPADSPSKMPQYASKRCTAGG